MKQQTLIVFLLLLFGIVANAQEKLRLSLNEANDYAMEHNLTLKNARLDIEYSERQLKGAIAQGLPQVDASVDYLTYFNYELVFPFGGGGADISAEDYNQFFSEAMTQFPGANPQTIFAQGYIDGKINELVYGDEESNKILMSDQSTAKVQVGQLLFSGQYWVGIKAAKLGKKIAEQGLNRSILDVKESIASSYYLVLVTERSLNVFQKNIDNLKKIKGHTQKMYEAGVAEQTDVDQISIQVTMLENNQRSMKRALEMSYNLLRFQLGAEAGTEIELTENLDALLNETKKENMILTNFDIDSNVLYQMTSTQEEISEKMVDMERWAYSPTLTGFYSYNYKLLRTPFDMNPNNMAGLSMSIPVFSSGSRKHKLEQAKIQLDQARLNRKLIEDQLQMQEEQLRLDLQTAVENYNSQKENVEVAKRAFTSTSNKFDQGMVSSLDLTQANSNYLQAETSLIQSIMSLMQAKLALDKMYNQL